MKKEYKIIDKLDEQNPNLFTYLDKQFGDFLGNLSGNDPEFILAARLVSRQTGTGNICVHIPSIAGRNIFDVLGEDSESNEEILLYSQDKWIRKLKSNPSIGRPGDFKPLILDDSNRLYFYRYWDYEQRLVRNIQQRLKDGQININTELLKGSLARLFKPEDDIDQRIASIAAVLRRFCVISGGPGTGKTSTVIKILIMLLEQAYSRSESLRIALAAPTGKAAARLNEFIKESQNILECSDDIKRNIPVESYTIHRLLGPIQGSPYFRYNAENQLQFDVVVVDESSMADLALMAKLFEAIPFGSRIILLGDKDQLASVEAGSVLGDICDTGKEHKYTKGFINNLRDIFARDIQGDISDKLHEGDEPAIADSIMLLSRSYRFGQRSGIGELSRAIKAGDADSAVRLLKKGDFGDITFIENTGESHFKPYLSRSIISGFSPYIKAMSNEEALKAFSNFIVFCTLRRGPYGVESINLFAEEMLKKNGLISVDSRWYEFRPVMIIRNDYNISMYNGDVGLILRDHNDERLYFFSSSHSSIRKILPLKLPEHETVYAMTVHKSQGSEFNSVLLLLPDRINPVLTRELLYTAVTRARERVEILGTEDILRYMINNPTYRISGLRDALWG